MNEKIRIAYIIDDLQIGGAQVHLVSVINEMCSKYQVEIISLGHISEDLKSRLHKMIRIRSYNMSSIWKPIFFFSFFRLIMYLRHFRPDIVHTYLNTANVFGLVAARIAGVKNIVTSRRDMGHFRSKRIAWIEGITSRMMASRVFCVCKAVARITQKEERIQKKKLRVLLNGVDIEHYQAKKTYSTNGTTNFGMVAAMNRVIKGHSDFVEAAAIASRKCDEPMAFYLAGDGPLRSGLERNVCSLGLVDKFHFLGNQKDVKPFLKKIDVLVVPSHSEGISNAVLEAMATGIPVIATAVDGNIEVVIDKETGFFVPVKDHQAMSECIINYVKDRKQIEGHGKNAKLRINDLFTLERMATSYFNEYDDILESN